VDSAPTRLMVVGSADMLANNHTLIVNASDWLLEDTALLDIRTTITASDQFDPPEGAASTYWRLGIVGAPLVLLVALGGVVLVTSRRRP
jgi:hypothetical protein